MTSLSNHGAPTSRRAAVALVGSGLLMAGLAALPANAGQHTPHNSGSSSSHSSSGSSATPRSDSSSSQSSSSARSSSGSHSRHAVPRGSSSSESSSYRTPSHSRSYGSHHGGYYGGHTYSYYGHYNHYPTFGYYWWNSFYSPWWAWNAPPLYVSTYSDRAGDSLGALDLDVSPERAEVYIDGELVGTADDYDGWPSYLWLERGTYDVVFYYPGYKTMARQIIVRPGSVVDIEDEMERGEAVRPEDLGPKSHERRDARLAEEAEKQAAAEARERGESPDWRERMLSQRRPRVAAPTPERDLRGEPGKIVLSIEPSDAAVYLDGRFLGTADHLGRLDGPLLIDAGDHDLEVVRPGYGSRTKHFSVTAGETMDLDVRLDRQE